jgi:hypothetical protein
VADRQRRPELFGLFRAEDPSAADSGCDFDHVRHAAMCGGRACATGPGRQSLAARVRCACVSVGDQQGPQRLSRGQPTRAHVRLRVRRQRRRTGLRRTNAQTRRSRRPAARSGNAELCYDPTVGVWAGLGKWAGSNGP